MKSFSVFVSSLFFVLLSLTAGPVYADDVVVLGLEALPWCGVVDGKETGIMVDILNEATKYGAPRFQFKFGLPWLRAQQIVHENNAIPTAIIPFSRTAERENNFKWIAVLASNEMRLASYKRAKPIETLEEVKTLKVGAPTGNAGIQILKKLGFTDIDESSADIKVNLHKLLSSRYDTVVDSYPVIRYNWTKLGQNPKDLQQGPLVAPPIPMCIAGDLNFPEDVAKRVSDAVEKMRKVGKVQEILDRWM